MTTQSEQLNFSNVVGIHEAATLDRFSELPENILNNILGFLPTKCAVATCVLSKIWQYSWIDVPVLDFTGLPSTNSDGTLSKEHLVCFKNFMNRVLLLNFAPCLERVLFEIYDCLPPLIVMEWLIVIARRRMKELYVLNKVHLLIGVSSHNLLAKKELVVLKLKRLFFQDFQDFECRVHLPRLKTLSLEEVEFEDGDDPFAIIVSNCPLLEELNIDCCRGFEKFSVQSTSLRTLRIVSCNKRKEAVIIQTPSLESLYLSIGIKQSLIGDLPFLVEARLDVWTSTVRWVNLLQKFRFVKTLVLYRVILDGKNVVNKLSTFVNLTTLEVAFSPWPTVLQILKSAPNLTSLVIQNLMFDWPGIPPKSKELSLERIECHCFNDLEEGYAIVQFFLSNSKALKELKIHTRKWQDSKSRNKILKSLVSIPKPQINVR